MQITPEQEIEALRNQAQQFEQAQAGIKERIGELEQAKSE
jgi:hypothetical protein